MNVLVPTWFGLSAAGGCQSHVKDLKAGLIGQGHQVDLITSDTMGQPVASQLLLAPLYMASRERYRAALTAIGRQRYRRHLDQIFRACTVDVVHAHDVFIASLFDRWRPVPLVLTVHGYAAFEAASVGATSPGSAYYKALQKLERMAYHAATQIITVDSRLRDYVLSFDVSPNKVRVIPNAVNTTVFTPNETHTSAHPPTILCPRRLVPKNGPEVAVRAAKLLQQDFGVTVRLLFAGDGPLEASLKAEVSRLKLPMVDFRGAVPHEQMVDLYRAADVVVIPSVTIDGIQEATSISALEGMACGRPVIASAIGGLAEIIDHDHTGWLVPPNDAAALAASIAATLKNSALGVRVGQEAASFVRHRFGTEQWIARKVQTYVDAIASFN